MSANINTREYWDARFASGDWEKKQGRSQTAGFARAQIARFGISPDFSGTLLDFGCGLGDSFPVYRRQYPKARLIGVEISAAAVASCTAKYGGLAEFIAGDHRAVPEADVIVSSNVFEHLTDDLAIARTLLSRCRDLYITVPYREALPLLHEHVNQYDESHFAALGPSTTQVFPCEGWSEYGWPLWYSIRLKNLGRLLMGRPLRHRNLQIMFRLRGTLARPPAAVSG